MSGQQMPIKILKTSKMLLPPIDRVRISVLVEDSTNLSKPELIAKHGLSFYLESKAIGVSSNVLIDTGPAPDIALRNAINMNIDLKKVDSIFLTHGHYDHSGAILEILGHINRPVPIVAHPEIFNPKIAYKPKLTSIGLACDLSDIRSNGGILFLTRNSFKITEGIMTTGEIQRKTDFENVIGLWTIRNDLLIKDTMLDEQSLLINIKNKGLVIIIGCGHPGVINIIRHAMKITGIKKIYSIIGGMHLVNYDNRKIKIIVKELSKIDFSTIYPCHCTGTKAINQLLTSFGERCIPIHTGSILKF
jgi:7,8-dihydropterin-6-yl-methyl-4-(beta-D-ribofuranosyl)aminobenzene 5'-phosphate synthase